MLFTSTDQTNRLNMPLFNTCSITSLKKIFQVATVFLSGDIEADYDWAILQLAELLHEYEMPPP